MNFQSNIKDSLGMIKMPIGDSKATVAVTKSQSGCEYATSSIVRPDNFNRL